MTEGQAKTKWCPHRRLTEIGNVRVTNIASGIHTLNCLGSACMMWRWDQGQARFEPAGKTEDGEPLISIEFDRPGNGYCGLAGRP